MSGAASTPSSPMFALSTVTSPSSRTDVLAARCPLARSPSVGGPAVRARPGDDLDPRPRTRDAGDQALERALSSPARRSGSPHRRRPSSSRRAAETLVARFAEGRLSGSQQDREHHQPELVRDRARGAFARAGLPWTTMSRLSASPSASTSSARSPLRTVELFHSGSSRVEETTYLGIVLNLSANSPSLVGHGKPLVGHPPQ